jgi:predicted RNA-binding protein
MCEASAFLIKEGQEQLFMEAVDIVDPEGENSWRLVDIFGDQKMFKGRLKGMNLVNHRITFEEE